MSTSYFFDLKHVDAWFKWIGWVIATAVISAAWWKVQSHLILPLVVISFVYVWTSACKGFGFFLRPFFLRRNWSEEVSKPVALIISALFTFYALITLTMLFIALLKS